MTTDIQINDCRTLFIFLSNATIFTPEREKEQIFNIMAFKLHEWANVPYPELRKVMDQFGYKFNPICFECEQSIEEESNEETCENCLKK